MSELPFPPARLAELSRLLDLALDLPEAEQLAWVDSLTAADAELAPALRRLLDPAAARAAAAFLERPPHLFLGEADEEAAGPRPGGRIGPYQLEQELGHGGMGSVWLAARSDGAYRRQVALKLPHPHLLRGRNSGRFRRERDILAALEHPHIARFLDAGIDPSGQPYLALEWVEGEPITQFCAARRSSLGERLALIEQVVSAVHYAHGRLIVHRDIKPPNVLVTRAGRVQLLDFGIAKLLEEEGSAGATQLTAQGESLATPEYAAPEQLLLGPITVATDVYAIGILLFELLSGRRPPAVTARPGFPHLGAADEAALLSRSIAPGHGAAVGGLSDRALSRALEGDLDAIVAKALALDPAKRYASAEALARDLERQSRGEPIAARHIGKLALAGKFLRRHRLGASLSLALLLAVAAGVGGVVWQSAQKAREARRAAATRDFLLGIFQGGDPRVPRSKPRGQTTARELLDLAAARIDHDLRDDPETRLELLDLTATSYLYLDELPKAREFARLAKEAGAEEYAADDPRQIDLVFFEIWADLQASDRPAAAAHLSQLDQSLRQAGLDHSRHRAEYFLAQGDLAQLDKDPAGREKALREAAALFAEVAPEDSGYPATLANLAAIAFNRDQLERAAELYQTALTAALKRPEAELERTRLASRRGRVLTELGRYQEAENDLTRARRGFAATLGQDHPTAWQATAALARLNCLEGRHQEADALFATLPSERPGESPGLAERWAEAKLLQGLCLAQRPDHQAEGARLLRETSAILAGQAEAQADLRRAAAALAAL